jgi:PhnB protein
LRDLPRPGFKARLKTDLERRTSMTTLAEPVAAITHPVTPYLAMKDAAAAIEFYKQAFGAKETVRLTGPGTRIGHAEIEIAGAPIMLSDEFPDYGSFSPQTIGGSPVKIHLYVDDVDALARQAVAAGATMVRPVEDQFYGDRSGQLADPFGYTWIVSTRKETVSAQEVQRRFDAMMQAGALSQPAQPGKSVSPIRKGFHTVTPYLMVNQAAELIDFVKKVFSATEDFRSTGSAGGLHCELRLRDSVMMIGGGGAWHGTPSPTALHLYVPDTDAVYRRALEAGATSLRAPADQPYGDRDASVRDPYGNHWYIGTHQAGGAERYIPEGLGPVNVYLHPKGTESMIAFLERALGAKLVERAQEAGGPIHHATLRIGDSILEMGEAHDEFQPMPTTFYLYVEDCDTLYRRALDAGAISINPPADQAYGDRNAGVKDPFGNTWYLSTHIRDVVS